MGKFGFENLNVWQKAIEFAKKVIDITETIDTDRRHYRLVEQIESSATSIAANIAEGKGRYSKKEYAQFLFIARGSLFETVTHLTIFHQKGWVTKKAYDSLYDDAVEISKMISGLVNAVKQSNS